MQILQGPSLPPLPRIEHLKGASRTVVGDPRGEVHSHLLQETRLQVQVEPNLLPLSAATLRQFVEEFVLHGIWSQIQQCGVNLQTGRQTSEGEWPPQAPRAVTITPDRHRIVSGCGASGGWGTSVLKIFGDRPLPHPDSYPVVT